MKNQYVGDINDFRKYGLIRALQAAGELTFSVGWMLTPDDGSTDGGLRRYLREPGRWQHYDAALFDHLAGVLASSAQPAVEMIETSGLLPRARFFSDLVPDDRSARIDWGDRMVLESSGADLVFLDPDNGLEIPSKPIGRKGSRKYAAWRDVEQLWEGGSSLLIYQHFCREPRDVFTLRRAADLRRHTGARFVEAFRTPHVLFLLAAQSRHRAVFEDAIARHVPRWEEQVTVAGLLAGEIE